MSTDLNLKSLEIEYQVLHQLSAPTMLEMVEITRFLHENLGEYRDDKPGIQASLEYAFNKSAGTGGFAILAIHESNIVGACVINTTAMKGYIPSNTLVYIATAESSRGKGIATELLKKSIRLCKGGLALHVEPDNPARKLYEKVGFKYKYLEMRLET